MTGVLESEARAGQGWGAPAKWLVSVVGLFGLFFAIAWVSQWWIMRKWYLAESVDLPAPTVVPHSATMTVVGVLALTIAVPLLRQGMFTAAALACAGAAIGPLRLLAAPVFTPLSESNEAIADFAWRLVVGIAALVVLLLVARWLAGPAVAEPPRWAAVVLLLIAVPVFVLLLWPGARELGDGTDDIIRVDTAVGWGLLAGGLVAAGTVSRAGTAVVRGLLAAAMAALLWWAYAGRDQAVPGWEYGGDEPLSLTAEVSIMLGVCALAGLLLAVSGVGRRGGSPDP